jgi:uncharacterized membrane protein
MPRLVWLMLLIVLALFAVSAAFYPQMPERVASHWNAKGQVDGYMSRFWGLFFLPILSTGLVALLLLVPRIDPLKANIAAFRGYYDGFIVLMLGFMLYIHILTILWNKELRFNMVQAMAPAMGALFFWAGVMIKHAQRNWFIGIRTPWTLSSDTVWNRTHAIGGRLFQIAGLLCLLAIPFPSLAIWLILVPVMSVGVYTVVYSYWAYQQESRRQ